MLFITGCGKATKSDRPNSETSESDASSRIDEARTGAGAATRYQNGPNRIALWEIDWNKAQLEYDQEGRVGGDMAEVKGRIFQKGKQASSFVAKNANAKFGTSNLELTGQVRLVNDDPAAILDCDRVVWNPELDRIEARGKVMLESGRLKFGPFETLYASPDLKEFSTPDLFRKTK